MEKLADVIRKNKNLICESLHIGYANWDDLLERIERQERIQRQDYADEKIWTFLVGCAYAMQSLKGTSRLAQLLIESDIPVETKGWFEVLPLSPREREGSTHLDLAFGNIGIREGTQSGIELGNGKHNWISFVECKWYSDIANSVCYDKHRNQLARVIENAVFFSKGDKFAQQIHVTLVTPEVFKSHPAKSRLYCYKFADYMDHAAIVQDITSSFLPHRRDYPDLNDRLNSLHLHWVSYETLFKHFPDSILKQPLLEFEKLFNGTRNKQMSKNDC